MIDKNLVNPSFQTFYISHEQSNCPHISGIIKVSKKFKNLGLLDIITTAVISLSYGKRVLINGNNVDFENIKKEELLEIVDYDPVKKIVLAIGQKEPNVETPVHWLIHHARDDVNAIIQLNSKKLVEQFSKKLPVTEKEHPSGSLELAKEVLKTLRMSKSIVLINKGVLFVGVSLKEVEDLVLKTYEGSK